MNRLPFASLVVVFSLFAARAESADVLFPTPLHLTRSIEDPISKSRTVVEEYYQGYRAIAIRDARTSIADYEKGTLTEIDRSRGTYSITKFETIAKVREGAAGRLAVAVRSSAAPDVRSIGRETRASRSAEIFESRLSDAGATREIRIAVDRELTLSREAVDVIIGAAYPNRRTDEHDVAIAAARAEVSNVHVMAGSAPSARYGLLLEHSVEHILDGERLQFRNVVTRVGSELPPHELISIPPGARLVESETFSIEERLREVDALPRKTP